MIYINLDNPYETAVQNLKRYYAIKGNQTMIENLIRDEAIRLGLWPQPVVQRPTRDAIQLPTFTSPPLSPETQATLIDFIMATWEPTAQRRLLILHGDYATGKTSLINALVIACRPGTYILDAADVQPVRDQLADSIAAAEWQHAIISAYNLNHLPTIPADVSVTVVALPAPELAR